MQTPGRTIQKSAPRNIIARALRKTGNYRYFSRFWQTVRKSYQAHLHPNPYRINRRKKPAIGILKNGLRPGVKPVIIGRYAYVLNNTCAFDSLVQLFCASLKDSRRLVSHLKSSSNETVLLCRDILENGIRKATYRKRAMILKKHFKPVEHLWGVKLLSVECSIAEMARKVLSGLSSISSVSTCSAESCDDRVRHFSDVYMTVFCSARELRQLDSKLLAMTIEQTTGPCGSNCNGVRSTQKNISEEYFLLEIIDPQKDYADIAVTLRKVPRFIKIEDREYELRGLVGYVGSSKYSSGEIGHYICFALRSGAWKKYDGLSIRPIRVWKYKKVRLQLLLYSRKP